MKAPLQVGVTPHGGQLVNRTVPAPGQAEARARAARLPAVELDARAASDLLLVATGAFSPLEGFMGYEAARSVVEELRLPDGTLWPLPVLLQVDPLSAADILPGKIVALRYAKALLGTLRVEHRFSVPRREWAAKVFQTDDLAHPGVAAFRGGGEIALGGRVEWFGDTKALGLDAYWLTPAETRDDIAKRGWKSVAGFQTRNPIHRAHEYVLRTALEITDGLLLHPLVGETRDEDVPATVRMQCYKVLLNYYLPPERVLLSVLPAWMRYAGPREAVLHALVRKNFGCTHFLVGRDHAGVGRFYGPYEAHRLVRELSGSELGIQPILFDEVFYCRRCSCMASKRTCPHPAEEHLKLSGTEVRRLLREGVPLPEQFTRHEVAHVLAKAFRKASEGSE